MIVEDDASVCAFTESALKELGYRTFAFTNALQALDIIKKDKPKMGVEQMLFITLSSLYINPLFVIPFGC